MNFNTSAFINSNKMKISAIRDRYTTFRSLGSLLNNYCLIATLPIDNIYKYEVMVVCSIEISSGAKFEKQDFMFRVYNDNGMRTAIVSNDNCAYFDVVGDVLNDKLNVYVKSKIAGGTVRIDPLYGINLGFVNFHDKSDFSFLEENFSKMINTTIAEKVRTTPYNSIEKISIDGGTIAKQIEVKRTKADGSFSKLVGYVSNKGEAVISKNKDNVETVGEYDTAMLFGENAVSVALPIGGAFNPNRDSSNSVGNINNKWKKGFYSDGVIISRTSTPESPENGLTFFHAVYKKIITYWDGKYYCNGEEINI